MSVELRKTSVKLYQRQYDVIERMAKNEGTSISDVMRELIDRALTEKVTEENTDLIAHIVKKQLEVVLKPHVERLAALSSKGGHMAARATFLNVQALMDLVPPENRKDVRAMYESASKKAVAYMHMPVEEYEV
mgnify:FL=1